MNANVDTMLIRWCIRADYKELLAVDSCCYAESLTMTELEIILSARDCIAMVAEDNHMILGYVIYVLSQGATIILRMGVTPRVRRCRIATAILTKMKSKLDLQGRRYLFVDVDEAALPAQLCLSRAGFIGTMMPDKKTIKFKYRTDW